MTMRAICDAIFYTCAAVAIALCVVIAAPAAGQIVRVQCADRDAYAKHLYRSFREQPRARALSSNGTVIEVFATPDGSSWTILRVYPNGAACAIDGGEAWLAVDPAALDPDA
ncbi:MAG: hypothetical protein MI806_07375 [Minwuiales bacterium]|nr:hypothetical protein [Minwuiales bacterium]